MKKKILIVDDDFDLLEQMTVILTAAGYEVVSAEGRAEAEEKLLEFKPDLAILDLMMEEKDSGFVLGHQIRRLYPDIPILLLTAVAGETGLSFSALYPEAQSWIKANRIMDKPVRPEQLRNEVHRLLQEAADAGGGHA